jgi:hypothetical protein
MSVLKPNQTSALFSILTWVGGLFALGVGRTFICVGRVFLRPKRYGQLLFLIDIRLAPFEETAIQG